MEAVGFVLAGLLGILSIVLFKATSSLARENMELKRALIKTESNKFLYDMSSMITNMKKAAAKPQLQKQTEQLLVLAIRSSNENEARSAAVQACKRIHKELGLK